MSHTLLPGTRAPVKVWTDPATIEPEAARQLRNIGNLPWVDGVAVMPDVHYGKGATVGSVIAMRQARVARPRSASTSAAACPRSRTSLTADRPARRPRPAARRDRGGDPGRLRTRTTTRSTRAGSTAWRTAGWDEFWAGFGDARPQASGQLEARAHHADGHARRRQPLHRGLRRAGRPDDGQVWLMLHSGSRNIGKELAERHIAVAQRPAAQRRPARPRPGGVPRRHAGDGGLPARPVLGAGVRAPQPRGHAGAVLRRGPRRGSPQGARSTSRSPATTTTWPRRAYDGVELLVTRKGAIRAGRGDLGHHPGLDGHRLVHRARPRQRRGRSARPRTARAGGCRGPQAKQHVHASTDLAAQTAGVECRKDAGVVDEIPGAYKDIGEVIAQQADLVEVVAQLKQVLCVKG